MPNSLAQHTHIAENMLTYTRVHAYMHTLHNSMCCQWFAQIAVKSDLLVLTLGIAY